MGQLDNHKHEAFCNFVLTEPTLAAAYLKAFPHTAKWARETRHNNASKFAKKDEVIARIAELRVAFDDSCIANRREILIWHSSIFRDESEQYQRRFQSAEVICRMQGFDKPVEQVINVYGQHTINKQYVSVGDVDEG